jgi:hypothetical protein
MCIVSGKTYPLFLSDINQILFSGYNLKKTEFKFREDLSTWSRIVVHTDMAEANGRFPQYRERDHKFLPLHEIEPLFLVFSPHNIINIFNEVYQF